MLRLCLAVAGHRMPANGINQRAWTPQWPWCNLFQCTVTKQMHTDSEKWPSVSHHPWGILTPTKKSLLIPGMSLSLWEMELSDNKVILCCCCCCCVQVLKAVWVIGLDHQYWEGYSLLCGRLFSHSVDLMDGLFGQKPKKSWLSGWQHEPQPNFKSW